MNHPFFKREAFRHWLEFHRGTPLSDPAALEVRACEGCDASDEPLFENLCVVCWAEAFGRASIRLDLATVLADAARVLSQADERVKASLRTHRRHYERTASCRRPRDLHPRRARRGRGLTIDTAAATRLGSTPPTSLHYRPLLVLAVLLSCLTVAACDEDERHTGSHTADTVTISGVMTSEGIRLARARAQAGTFEFIFLNQTGVRMTVTLRGKCVHERVSSIRSLDAATLRKDLGPGVYVVRASATRSGGHLGAKRFRVGHRPVGTSRRRLLPRHPC